MIKHIVMWRLKEEAENGTKKENAQKIKEMIEELPKEIPQIIKIEIGFNFNPSEAAYDIGLYSEFNSKEDLKIYQKHPQHVKVANFVNAVKETGVVVDYELT